MPFNMNPTSKLSLTWTSFKKLDKAPAGSKLVAYTDCQITPSQLQPDKNRSPGKYMVNADKFTVSVNVTFNSWVLKSIVSDQAQSARLLNHERTHYLIASCWAYDFYGKALDAEENSVGTLQKTLESLRNDMRDKSRAMQAQYDNETNHGGNASKQREWDLRIEAWDRQQSE